MVIDKSLSYYGRIYHFIIDPLLKESRNQIINLIPENSKVLDAGCGTGVLSLLLKEKRNCKVVGVDLSLKMIDFAKSQTLMMMLTFYTWMLEKLLVTRKRVSIIRLCVKLSIKFLRISSLT